ncbi:hypothetical protein FB6_0602 [Serratia marcescens]|nr:hypothetical protein FB6_0602 [Serratia marcescens]
MNLLNKILSKVLVGTSYAIGSMTLVIIGYFLFLSESGYKYAFALLTCLGFVLGYFVYKLAMRFYDGL